QGEQEGARAREEARAGNQQEKGEGATFSAHLTSRPSLPTSGEGAPPPNPTTATRLRGSCFGWWRPLPLGAGGGGTRGGGLGRGRTAGRLGLCGSAPPPSHPGGGKPLPYFGLTPALKLTPMEAAPPLL